MLCLVTASNATAMPAPASQRVVHVYLRAVLLPIVLCATLFATTQATAQSPLWDTSPGGGFAYADELVWRTSYGPYSSVDEVTEAAYEWCKTTADYDNPLVDCKPHQHPNLQDYVEFSNPAPNQPQFSYFYVVVNMYRNNGFHGTAGARWYPYYTTNAACGTGNVVGPKHYECVPEEYYVEEPPQPSECNESNPCNPADGNKSQVEIDYIGPGNGGLSFVRYYNSKGAYKTGEGMGNGWRHSYSRRLNEGPDRAPDVTFASPVAQSTSYSTASAACTSGWSDIKSVAYGGDLSAATATFSGGDLCKIESGGSTLAMLPIRFRHGSFSGFTPASTSKKINRPDGSQIVFVQSGSNWVSVLNPDTSLVASGSNWVFTDENDTKETYNSAGRLTLVTHRTGQVETMTYNLSTGSGGDGDSTTLDRVTGPFGHKITIKHNNGLVKSVTTPDGIIQYLYKGKEDIVDQLVRVTYPGSKIRNYLYEDTDLPDHLTGIRVSPRYHGRLS